MIDTNFVSIVRLYAYSDYAATTGCYRTQVRVADSSIHRPTVNRLVKLPGEKLIKKSR